MGKTLIHVVSRKREHRRPSRFVGREESAPTSDLIAPQLEITFINLCIKVGGSLGNGDPSDRLRFRGGWIYMVYYRWWISLWGQIQIVKPTIILNLGLEMVQLSLSKIPTIQMLYSKFKCLCEPKSKWIILWSYYYCWKNWTMNVNRWKDRMSYAIHELRGFRGGLA